MKKEGNAGDISTVGKVQISPGPPVLTELYPCYKEF